MRPHDSKPVPSGQQPQERPSSGLFSKSGSGPSHTDSNWVKSLTTASKYADYGKKRSESPQKSSETWDSLAGVLRAPWTGEVDSKPRFGKSSAGVESGGERNSSTLLHSEAKFRSEHVEAGSIQYSVVIFLDSGREFDGQVAVEFTLKKEIPENAGELFFDFAGDSITRYVVNGVPAPPYGMKPHLAKGKVWIPKLLLKPVGKPNKVVFAFRSALFSDYGLVDFRSHTEERVVYAWSEPFWNNRIFPMFDQPDLKSSFQLYLLVPKTFTAVSSVDPEYELAWEHSVLAPDSEARKLVADEATRSYIWTRHTQSAAGQLELWPARFSHKLIVFPPSAVMSSYLFNFAVGDLSVFQHSPAIKIYYLHRHHSPKALPERWAHWFGAYTSVSARSLLFIPRPSDIRCSVILH